MRVRARVDREVNYWLTSGKEYTVIGISNNSFRVLNDGGEPTLFDKSEFDIIEDSVPSKWLRQTYEDGEWYIDPPGFEKPGFWEDFFDHKQYAVDRFNEYLREHGIALPENLKLPPHRRSTDERGDVDDQD